MWLIFFLFCSPCDLLIILLLFHLMMAWMLNLYFLIFSTYLKYHTTMWFFCKRLLGSHHIILITQYRSKNINIILRKNSAFLSQEESSTFYQTSCKHDWLTESSSSSENKKLRMKMCVHPAWLTDWAGFW